MAIDHSLTYRKLTLRNVPHFLCAATIAKIIKKLNIPRASIYFDVGCSNGYLTARIARMIEADSAIGFDHCEENLNFARRVYPHLEFRNLDLNVRQECSGKADLVTCFETMEHVGNVDAAIYNIYAMVNPGGGVILYTVPIESGFIGTIKYIVKTKLFGYTLRELTHDPKTIRMYQKALFSGKDISSFRNTRSGWGTHFGFDYREFEQRLAKFHRVISAWTSGTSRFILIDTRSNRAL